MDMSLDLAEKILNSRFIPDVVVAILRGGYFVAKLISDFLGLDNIATLEIKFYKGIGEKAERPIVIHPITFDLRDKKTLVVDDVADSGRTLQVAIDIVRLHGAKEVRTATLFFKPWSITMPDYYVEETEKWIVFPWEIGETIRDLKKKLLGYDRVLNELKLYEAFNTNSIDKLLNIIKKVEHRLR